MVLSIYPPFKILQNTLKLNKSDKKWNPLYTKFNPIFGSGVLTITKINYPIWGPNQLINFPLIAKGMILSIYPHRITPKTLKLHKKSKKWGLFTRNSIIRSDFRISITYYYKNYLPIQFRAPANLSISRWLRREWYSQSTRPLKSPLKPSN